MGTLLFTTAKSMLMRAQARTRIRLQAASLKEYRKIMVDHRAGPTSDSAELIAVRCGAGRISQVIPASRRYAYNASKLRLGNGWYRTYIEREFRRGDYLFHAKVLVSKLKSMRRAFNAAVPRYPSIPGS